MKNSNQRLLNRGTLIKVLSIALIFSAKVVQAGPKVVNYYDMTTFWERLEAAQPASSITSSVTTPTAYGMGWRSIALGVSGQDGTQSTRKPFGEYAVGFGLGDPDRLVALTTMMTLGGLNEVVRDGNFNFQLSRNIVPGMAVAMGIENVAGWGGDKEVQKSKYLVASRSFKLDMFYGRPLGLIGSLGVGNSRFVHDITPTSRDLHRYAPFAGLNIQVLPQASWVMDYVGETLNTGMTVIPFVKLPMVASLTFIDLTHRGGRRIPISGSIGYSITF